jgi:hypothetical protein
MDIESEIIRVIDIETKGDDNPIINISEKAFSALKVIQEREKPITILSVLNRNNIVVGMLRMHDLVKEGL